MSGYMFHEQQVYRMVNDNGVLPVNFYGFEAVKFADREAVINEVLTIIDDVKSDANKGYIKGYMFDMVDEIEKRVLALRGGEH